MSDEKNFQIYLDLDGLFSDFEEGFKKVSGYYPKEVAKGKLWGTIHRAEHFFYNLPMIKESKKLWQVVEPTDPIFLTGLPSSAQGKEDKIRWVHKHYGDQYEVIVVPKKEKRNYAKPNHILIDDTHSNVNEWNADGGIGIFHEKDNFHRTITELKNILKDQFNWTSPKI